MSRAFITGGLGFIGSHIARRLLEDGHVDQVVCLDHYGRYVDSARADFVDYRMKRLQQFQEFSERVIIERGEAKFYSVLSRLIDRYRPEYVFHLASIPLAKLSNLSTEEALEGTVVSTSNIMEVIAQLHDRDGYKPKRVVYASSSMVYGDFLEQVAREDHPTNPKEPYGTMKLAGEKILHGLGLAFDIPVTTIRPSAVYGPTDMNRRVSQIFVEKAFRGEKLTVHGVDEELDFTHVRDAARGFTLAAVSDKGKNEIFNITHGRAHTLLDFVQCLEKHFPDLEYEIAERDVFRPKRGTLSIDKARELIGYEPEVMLQEGVDEYVAFLKEHHPDFGGGDAGS